MKLKFERCTAESLAQMFRHYFDMELPEAGDTHNPSIISHYILYNLRVI